MSKALFLVAALFVARPAAAQSLKIPTLVFAGAASADWVTTYRFLTATPKHLEGNPLLGFTHSKPAATLAAGIAIDAGTLYLVHRVVGPKHPKIAAFGLYAVAGFRAAIAYSNTR